MNIRYALPVAFLAAGLAFTGCAGGGDGQPRGEVKAEHVPPPKLDSSGEIACRTIAKAVTKPFNLDSLYLAGELAHQSNTPDIRAAVKRDPWKSYTWAPRPGKFVTACEDHGVVIFTGREDKVAGWVSGKKPKPEPEPKPKVPAEAEEGGVNALPAGLFCRDLNARGFGYSEAVDYWRSEGTPDRMDADLNGIPCETVYPAADVTAYWGDASDSFGNGQYIVGEDIQPGTYRTEDAHGFCYWERLRNTSGNFSGIITNGGQRGQNIVTIKPTDAAFSTDGCGTWTLVD